MKNNKGKSCTLTGAFSFVYLVAVFAAFCIGLTSLTGCFSTAKIQDNIISDNTQILNTVISSGVVSPEGVELIEDQIIANISTQESIDLTATSSDRNTTLLGRVISDDGSANVLHSYSLRSNIMAIEMLLLAEDLPGEIRGLLSRQLLINRGAYLDYSDPGSNRKSDTPVLLGSDEPNKTTSNE